MTDRPRCRAEIKALRGRVEEMHITVCESLRGGEMTEARLVTCNMVWRDFYTRMIEQLWPVLVKEIHGWDTKVDVAIICGAFRSRKNLDDVMHVGRIAHDLAGKRIIAESQSMSTAIGLSMGWSTLCSHALDAFQACVDTEGPIASWKVKEREQCDGP